MVTVWNHTHHSLLLFCLLLLFLVIPFTSNGDDTDSFIRKKQRPVCFLFKASVCIKKESFTLVRPFFQAQQNTQESLQRSRHGHTLTR